MTELVLKTNSIVILASSHNPTLVSETFFKKTGIIENFDDVDKTSLFITPLGSQIRLKDGTVFMLDNNKLNIVSQVITSKDTPFMMAKNYCMALPYIKCRAIGINFEYEANGDIVLEKLISSLEFDGIKTKSIDFTFPSHSEHVCNVKLNEKKIIFNHHKNYSNVTFEQVDKNFIDLRNSCETRNQEFITAITKKF